MINIEEHDETDDKDANDEHDETATRMKNAGTCKYMNMMKGDEGKENDEYAEKIHLMKVIRHITIMRMIKTL